MELIERNAEHNYSLYRSNYIINNLESVKYNCHVAHNRFKNIFPDSDSTENYSKYNLFSLTSTSSCFYNIFKELITCMKDYLEYQGIVDSPFWFQSWLNYHKQNEVLGWHDHNWPFHGYMSIDPKKSKTVFENFSIDNEVGFLYLGQGYKPHKVEVLESYDDERITIAYDITTYPDCSFDNLSLIPV